MKVVRLGDIGEGFIGLTYKPEDVSDVGIIVLRSGNIQNNKIDLKDTVRVNKNINKKLMLKDEDILICSRNGSAKLVGKSAIIEQQHETMTFGAFMMVYRSKNNKYLVHYFNSPYFHRQLISGATTTINQFTKKMLDEITVPLPNIDTQQKIVQVLDTAQSLIDRRKQQIEACDELIKSRFVEMFGDPVSNNKEWEVKRLDDICSKITDGTHDTPSRYSEGYLLITGKNIRCNSIDLNNIEFVSEEDHKIIYARCNPEYGDVLYTNIGVNYGTAVINTLEYEFSMKNVALLKPSKTILDGYYLWHVLNLLRNKILEQNQSGGAQTFMGLATIKNISIPVPNLEIQNQFSTFVNEVDKQKFVLQQSLSELEGNFNSLMQRAFKGELFPED